MLNRFMDYCLPFQWEPEDEKTRIFIRDFIKPEEHLMVLIDAYEKQPRLWNTKLYPNKLRTYKDNSQYLEEIAVELKSKLDINMPLTYNIVGAIILRMRSEYGVKLNRLRVNEQRGGTLKSRNMPDWYFEKMKFLEPFMDNYTLVQIGSHHLQPEEIVHILRIYERFPFLWNTTLPEYVCKNKHTEALKEMVNVLKSEMNIQVDEEVLKKYLYCVHGHYNTEKLIYENKRSLKKDSSLFYEHMKFLDGHVGPIYCPFAKCNRRVINPLFLKVHGNVVHELEPLRCPICDKIFTDVQRYKFHVRRHMGDSSETCKICGKQFVRTAEFKAHMRGHLGIRNYCCEICGASYSMPSSLLEHRKTHDERNKSQCQICFKIFVTKKRLTKHIRTTHTDIRNFDCTICGKAFKTKKTLKAHITIHEEGRNHPCPLCGKMFKNKIGVHHHLRTHRSNKEIKENPFMES